MSLTRILAITQRIIRQFKHDKRTLGLLLIVPIIVISILGPLLTVEPVFNIGIINNDKSFAPPAVPPVRILQKQKQLTKLQKLSNQIIDELEEAENTSVKSVKKTQISRLLKDDELIAAVTFPEDFTKSVLTGKSVDISVVIDGSNPSRAQGAIAKIQQALAGQGKSNAKLNLDIDYKYGGSDFDSLDYTAPSFIAFFAFFFVFLLTCVSFLRERGQGTIERLMASPASRLEIILGYMLGFIFFATIQVAIIMLYTIFALKVHYTGAISAIFLIVFLLTLVGVNMGIFFSSFAANELQVVQFIPVVIVPQGLLSGIIIPVKDLPEFLQWISKLLPVTHAIDALQKIMLKGFSLKDVATDIIYLVIFALLMLVLSTITIRRKIA